jgi:hypothetical protein
MSGEHLKRLVQGLIEKQRQRQWADVRFLIRATAITIGVCAATAAIGSMASAMWHGQYKGSQIGRISREIKAATPDIERRDKEIEELSRP